MIEDWAFYFITDEGLSRNGILHDVRCAIRAGVRVVQYRSKGSTSKKLYEEARVLRKYTSQHQVDLIVNDRLDIALAVGADGVHLGQSDIPASEARRLFPDGIVGVSAGNERDLRKALLDGADYIGVGPIYKTTTKRDARAPVGPDLLDSFRRLTSKPLIAIGGILHENLPTLVASGAHAICAISATIGASDVESSVALFEKDIRGLRMRSALPANLRAAE